MLSSSRCFLFAALAAFSLATGSVASAQQTLRIGDATLAGLQPESVDVLLTNTAPVEGFVLAITFDAAKIDVTNVSIIGTVTGDVGAELVIPELLDAEHGFTLGVVLDASSPFAGQTIAKGTAQPIATFDAAAVLAVAAQTTTQVKFTDGLNSPGLDNILVQGGMSVGIGAGLTAVNGTLTLLPPPPDELRIENIDIPANSARNARVFLSNSSGAVQGFVLAIEHDDGLLLEEINLEDTVSEEVGAEFVAPAVHDSGGTVGVVLDFSSPFAGQAIELGVDQPIANYVYRCTDPPIAPAPSIDFGLRFVDGTLGDPPLDNVLVVEGRSVTPATVDGVATCTSVPVENTEFLCGIDHGFDEISEPSGPPGEAVDVDLFYVDPDSDIQGYQIAMCFDPMLTVVEGSFTVEGTIADAVGAEFVTSSTDNVHTDGDGIEFTAGVLLDALPPFANQCMPSTTFPLRMGSFRVLISQDAQCDSCYEMRFCDGIDASQSVALDNLIVDNFQSVSGFFLHDCRICVTAENTFLRGDCNTDARVDIADAANVLGRQFQGVIVGCDDACDANDDGKADLADAVYLLNYLFRSGARPKAPFPVRGRDTTEDRLTCAQGLSICD